MANPHPTPAPIKFGAAEAQQVIDAATEGMTLSRIADVIGVNQVTLWRYRRANSEFDGALRSAMVHGAYKRLHVVVDELEAYLRSGGSAMNAKARLDLLKFYLEKCFPAEFSPRQQVDMNITIDLAGSIQRAQQRALTSAQVIDLTPTSVSLASDTISVAKPK